MMTYLLFVAPVMLGLLGWGLYFVTGILDRPETAAGESVGPISRAISKIEPRPTVDPAVAPPRREHAGVR